MEELGRRFPLISQIILNNIDDKSLTKFRKASRENMIFLDSERFYWIRNIKKYSANFQEFQRAWKKVIKRTPSEFLKNLAIFVHSFFKGYSPRYEKQWHPLFIGAQCGSQSLCEHVVERTGDVNHKRINGFTPLGFAAQEGHLAVCTFLIKYIDDKNPGDNDGYTPLHFAAKNGHLDVWKLLSNYLDNKNPSTKDGWTPLHSASTYGHLNICAAIITHLGNKIL